MIDFIAKLISGDGVTTILMAALAYVVLLWFLFSFWVYVDAKKRYKKTALAIVLFLVVFIFNFPALVFYLITRPENEDDFVIFPADNLSNRGVNIPIVNFIGKDGKVNFSFELKINNQEFAAQASDMSIDVNWKSENTQLVKQEEPVEVKKDEIKTSETKAETNSDKNKGYGASALRSFNSVKTKVGNFKPKFNLPKKNKDSKKESNS